MKISSTRNPGIFMVSLSIVLLISAVVSMFYFSEREHIPETAWTEEKGLLIGEGADDSRAHHPDGYSLDEIPSFYAPRFVFPFRWLTVPLTIVGIASLLVGLFFCRDELLNMF